ncbi:MAG: hypothetical protein LBT56_05510 [Prevotellaceae bacterium]|jgi:hypothetical protein|nr:hypothetical protein [Prevotellaceae bacterium]
MKSLVKKLCIITILFCAANSVYAQTERDIYAGVGAGFDYGGIGGKIEYLPAKHFGLFAGLGFNMSSLGWNIGATYKILPDKKISPNFMVFYGYNAVFQVDGDADYADKYNTTSYGFTIGMNLDVKSGSKGNKWSFGLFVPFRSSKFRNNYDAAKNDSYLDVDELIPIGISVGYNFKL